jgi:hypothetical protein
MLLAYDTLPQYRVSTTWKLLGVGVDVGAGAGVVFRVETGAETAIIVRG